MDPDRYRIITPLTDAAYRDHVRGLNKAAWPEFMLHEPVANELWHELLDRFPGYQLALYDVHQKRAAAMSNSIPLRWDGALADLPEEGWDWAFRQGVHDHRSGIPPNLHCALQVTVHPAYRRQGLSVPLLEAAHQLTRAKRLQALTIPVRPSEKSRYPLARMEDYIDWKTNEGLPFDAWLRVHVRLGGRILKVCPRSKTIRGTRTEWESWTGIRFPQTGSYIIPGALNPIEINVELDEGLYVEPNVWMVHPVK